MNNGKLLSVDAGIPAALYVKRAHVSTAGRTEEQLAELKKFFENLALRRGDNISWFREDDRYVGCYRPR